VGARKVTDSVDHGDHYEREGERHTHVGHRAPAMRIYDDGTWPNEHEENVPSHSAMAPRITPLCLWFNGSGRWSAPGAEVLGKVVRQVALLDAVHGSV
jgi:hypothetical protein